MERKTKDTRQVIADNLRVLRTLQSSQNDAEKKTINELSQILNIPWSSLSNVLKDFIAHKIIDKDYKIIPSNAYFMGISMTQDNFSLSLVDLDGKIIDLTQICNEVNDTTNIFNNFNYEYSLSSLIELLQHVRVLINGLKSDYPIKAVCLSFDSIDLSNKTFSTSNYYSDTAINSYPFEKICDICFGDLREDIPFFLDCNSACYVLLKEFPCIRKKGNQVYLLISKTGCYITTVIDGKIHYGYNLQTLNVTYMLSKEEKNVLLSNTVTTEEQLSILEKIITPFIISLSPDYFSIVTNLLSDNVNVFYKFMLQIPERCGFLFNGYMCPDYTVDIFPNISVGTAMSGMYQYYAWDFDFI